MEDTAGEVIRTCLNFCISDLFFGPLFFFFFSRVGTLASFCIITVCQEPSFALWIICRFYNVNLLVFLILSLSAGNFFLFRFFKHIVHGNPILSPNTLLFSFW